MSENPTIRRAIAQSLLDSQLDDDFFAGCPGRHLHTGASGRRDFMVKLEGPPTGFCLHSSCSGVVEEWNAQLRSLIGKAEVAEARGDGRALPPTPGPGPLKPETPRRSKLRPPYDPEKLRSFAARCSVAITPEWLAAHSPVPIPSEQGTSTAELFLSSLYEEKERVLVFTSLYTQGCYGFSPGFGCYRLSDIPGVKAIPAALPTGGPDGIWFLSNPVSGLWTANPNNRAPDGVARLGRRHKDCVTAWKYMVLESDCAPPELWLKALVLLPAPIVAVYDSGGRSIHALLRVNAASKADWDSLRDHLMPTLAILGADPAALTAVRLSRLPGTLRCGSAAKEPRLQRLLYLAPLASVSPILFP